MAPPPLLGGGAYGHAVAGGSGLGPPPPGSGQDATTNQLKDELLALRLAMQEMKTVQEKKDKKSSSAKKQKTSSSSKKKDSSSSESGSSSDGSGSDKKKKKKKKKYMVWVPKGEKGDDKVVSSEMLKSHSAFHLKKRSDLVTFAIQHPGALAAHLLAQARSRMQGSIPTNMTEIREYDLMLWSQSHGGLKDVRDQKEMALLSRSLAELGAGRYAQVADLLCMRIRELRLAKQDGSSWEKAAGLSLMPGSVPPTSVLPDTAFAL